MAKKRAFVKYTKAGDIIPGSLVFTSGSYPKDGLYYEVATDLCCTTETIPTVRIGTQSWTTKNLDVTTYRNGDLIPEVQDPVQWSSLSTGAWCSIDNNPANDAIYGKLYNWYAVNDPRGLGPVGFHVPNDTEWGIITAAAGGYFVAGGNMKETGTAHWNSPNTGATNSTGFTALATGWRLDDGSFQELGNYAPYWSTNEGSFPDQGKCVILSFSAATLEGGETYKVFGQSIRLIKD